MRSRLISLLTVFGAVTVLALSANSVAIASTGKGFILGKKNSASTVTTLKRTTPGAALSLRTKSNASAPMTVNGKGRVTNLNADKLDGLDSSALATKASVTAVGSMAPFANGYISDTGAFTAATTTGVSAVSWNSTTLRYEITLTGTNYYYSSFQTTITPACSGASVSASSAGGRLLVRLSNSDGAAIQCPFTFATTKLQ